MDLNAIDIVDYACEDVDITFQLKQLFEPQIQEKNLSNLFYNRNASCFCFKRNGREWNCY